MKWKPCTADTPFSPAGRKKTRTARITANTKRMGIPTLASFSIPCEMPRERT
jgi:hypothetical protein